MIGVRAFSPRLEAMQIPRLIVTRHPMGRTLGAPGGRERQRAVILAALDLLERAKEGGRMVELPESYHPGEIIA